MVTGMVKSSGSFNLVDRVGLAPLLCRKVADHDCPQSAIVVAAILRAGPSFNNNNFLHYPDTSPWLIHPLP